MILLTNQIHLLQNNVVRPQAGPILCISQPISSEVFFVIRHAIGQRLLKHMTVMTESQSQSGLYGLYGLHGRK
jgi:hypothetical protein